MKIKFVALFLLAGASCFGQFVLGDHTNSRCDPGPGQKFLYDRNTPTVFYFCDTPNHWVNALGSNSLSNPVTAVQGGTGIANTNTIKTGSANIDFSTLSAGLAKWVSGGAPANAAAVDVTGVFGSCSGVFYLGADGNCHPSGRGIPFTIGDPAGSALTAGATTTDYFTVPINCTINAYNLVIDGGTITVKFWKVGTGTAIPTSANSISTSGVGIASGTAIHSAVVSDFTTTAVAANDIMAMNVTAVSSAKYVQGVLSCLPN